MEPGWERERAMTEIGNATTEAVTSAAMTAGLPNFQTTDRPIGRGQAVARMATEEMIEELRRRAAAHQLDRGLRLSVAYFDDRRLALRWRTFTVIPRGRILFVPAFVVVAVEREIDRVRADRQYTSTTRDHLIALLNELMRAFGRDPFAPQA